MKPRTEPLRTPAKPGYLTVELPGKGPHGFRLPTWSEARRLAEYLRSRPGWVEMVREGEGWRRRTDADTEADVRIPPDSLDDEYAALLVGVSWHHIRDEFEATYPLDDPTPPKLLRFAQAVERELEEAGYSYEEIARLAGALALALAERQAKRATVQAEAKNLADFSAPPPASASSP